MEDAGRRAEAGPAGRNPPSVAGDAIDGDRHGLAAAIDVHHHAGFGAFSTRKKRKRQCGQKSRNNQTAHSEPPQHLKKSPPLLWRTRGNVKQRWWRELIDRAQSASISHGPV